MANFLKKQHLDCLHTLFPRPKQRPAPKLTLLLPLSLLLLLPLSFTFLSSHSRHTVVVLPSTPATAQASSMSTLLFAERVPPPLPASAHSSGSAYLNAADDSMLHNFTVVGEEGEGGDEAGVAGGEHDDGGVGDTGRWKEEGGEVKVEDDAADADRQSEVGEQKQEEAVVNQEENVVKQEAAPEPEQGPAGGGDAPVTGVETLPVAVAAEGGSAGAVTVEGGFRSLPDGECLKYIVYDKPVKTGSTAVRDALVKYFEGKGGEWVECTFDSCAEEAEKMVRGEVGKRNLVEHLQGGDGLVDRLGEVGYYKVTSIRDPRSRWESAYRYNKMMNATHYGIETDATYEEFMKRMPACSLYDFYDKKGGWCAGDEDERIREIVARYDEIIDLYQEDDAPMGLLHARLAAFIKISNKSPEYSNEGAFDEERLVHETRLYEALKRRKDELIGKEPALCD